jgi:broad specificity phosphatase PhoE
MQWWFKSILSCHSSKPQSKDKPLRSLFLIGRHGETVLNESGKYRGMSNGPDAQLNSDGRKSAHDLGKFVGNLGQKFSRIICSPLDRAQLTAAIVAGYVDIKKITIDDRLLPLNVGSLAGQPKDQNPIAPYLKDKNKKFPDGENINGFEKRQHSFAMDLLDTIEAGKQEDDIEVLVIAHVSNTMYWYNVQSGKPQDEYLDESGDIILPGGLAMVTEHAVVPIFKANPQSELEGGSSLPVYPPDHKVGMVVPVGGSNCAKCEYVNGQNCKQTQFVEWNRSSEIPAPVDSYCCDMYEIKK